MESGERSARALVTGARAVLVSTLVACGGTGPGAQAGDAGAAVDAAMDVSWVDDQSSSGSSTAADDGAAAHRPPTEVVASTTTPGPGRTHTSPSLVAGGVSDSVVVVFDDTDEDLTVHASGWARSTNGAGSFTDQGHLPDAFDGGVTDNYGSPCVARDAIIGNLYVASLGQSASGANGVALFVSANGGVTFNPAIEAADPNLLPSDYTDFPDIAVDNGSGQTQGLVYIAYADVVGGTTPVKLRLSTYENHAFAVTEVVSPQPGDTASLPSIAVAPNADLFIAYYSQVSGVPSIAVIRSEDQGQHFDAPTAVASLHIPVAADASEGGAGGDLGLVGVLPDGGAAPLEAYASPHIAANPVTGALYLVFVDAAPSDKANVYFTHSEDLGSTWSSPVRVNDDATDNDQFLPAVAVSPDGARVAVDFYDRRDDPANLSARRYGAVADIAGAAVTFGANFQVSASAFPVLVSADPYLSPSYFSRRSTMAASADSFFDAYAAAGDGGLDVIVAQYGIRY